MTININTKIATLLKHNPSALEAIVSLSPKFIKLRNPLLRKVIAGRTSISMASKLGGCRVDDFFDKLAPLGFEINRDITSLDSVGELKPIPEYLKNIPADKVIDLDVRPVIETGKDPLSLILQNVKFLEMGSVLKIINSFEPTPLMHLLRKQGFESYTEQIGEEQVNTYFYKTTERPLEIASEDADYSEGWNTILDRFKGKLETIDVRQLEMPMPMHMILETLETLQKDKALFVYHKRIPVFLLPELEDRNFSFRIKEVSDAEVNLLIYKDLFTTTPNNKTARTTSYKVVLPFYLYAGIAYFIATVLLLYNATDFTKHYFHPHILAVTHIMALGWGTMMILGASHQLVPVLIEGMLYSNRLAYTSFILAATGIPLLVYGFYVFDMGWPAQWGGIFLILAIIAYLINLVISMGKSSSENIHAVFVFTAGIWLLATVTIGWMLVYNFTHPLLPKNSLDYLPLHAHIGIVGWFLLLVTGIGSRLIPMFLISKYNNTRQLWWIYGLINIGLLGFIFIFLYTSNRILIFLPVVCVAAAIVLFGLYCYKAYQYRIRKKVDEQMNVSLLSVIMMLLPLIFLVLNIFLLLFSATENTSLVMTYGFIIFFGWISAIIMGMTFKTLPFIVWNKVYHHLAGKGKTPNPKELFSNTVFKGMSLTYLSGFGFFTAGILFHQSLVLQSGAAFLVITSFLYNWNVFKILMHKPVAV